MPGWLHVNIYGTQTLHVCHTWPYMPISWGGLGGQWGGIYGSPMGRVWGITPGSPGSSLVTGSRTIRRDPLRSRSRSFGHPSAETHPPAVYRAIFNQECSFFSTHVRKHRSTARNRAFSIYIDYISPPKKGPRFRGPVELGLSLFGSTDPEGGSSKRVVMLGSGLEQSGDGAKVQ